MREIRYRESVDIAVPPEEAWRYRLNFGHLPDVNPSVSNLRRTDGGAEPGVGASYTFDLASSMGPRVCTLTVVEAVPHSRIVNEMEAGMRAREVCTFEPAGDGGTHMEFEVTVFVPDEAPDDLGPQIEGSGRAQIRLEMDMMRKALEEGR